MKLSPYVCFQRATKTVMLPNVDRIKYNYEVKDRKLAVIIHKKQSLNPEQNVFLSISFMKWLPEL